MLRETTAHTIINVAEKLLLTQLFHLGIPVEISSFSLRQQFNVFVKHWQAKPIQISAHCRLFPSTVPCHQLESLKFRPTIVNIYSKYILLGLYLLVCFPPCIGQYLSSGFFIFRSGFLLLRTIIRTIILIIIFRVIVLFFLLSF